MDIVEITFSIIYGFGSLPLCYAECCMEYWIIVLGVGIYNVDLHSWSNDDDGLL